MTQNARNMTIVVTGATGRTGRRVAEAAREAGLTVREATRARGFDWAERSTWADTLRGADAAYLVYPSDVGAPDAGRAVGLLAQEAAGLGVRRLVLLSSRGEERARPTEEALRGSGADWTVVRASWFAQNFSEGPLVEGFRESGELVFPGGSVREPFVDVRDIADVVVAVVLGGERYVGRAVTVSGPRLLTFGEAVGEIGAVTGRELTYRAVSARQYGDVLAGFGVPAEEVEFLVELFESLLDGRNSYLSEGVQEVLGREPRDFSEFVRDAAAAGVWKVGS
ncbi:NmrA family transcriptional regulator [Streptomyces sp. NBC_01239]|uniref:NmrA family transcriptional regulator n=1 Tax=Streptomyces sp. NBC_01239 TaxID=2903792 RepID=UPI00224D4C46|nr:NmrA family transcriptional regulator [Streptomyces sp. NBC_01239]MCX4814721.1 NmrA family transcriptional regulator [Streptomyces sp. NBC_01239]